MSLNLGIIASSRTTAAPAALLLDTYPGAAAAYSLRKLRTAYTGSAIRVRRSSDNTQTDIGFNGSNGLDTTALTTFVGVGNGFVTIWYDQSGNANNLIQNTALNQMYIIFSGVLNTSGGKPCIMGNTGNIWFNLTTSLNSNTDYSQYFYTECGSSIGSSVSFSTISTSFSFSGLAFVSNFLFYFANRTIRGTLSWVTGKNLFSFYSISNVLSGYNNGTLKTITTTSATFSDNYTWFGRTKDDINLRGKYIECILYANNQSSNNSGINSNINTYYSIY
jgi:hypothetical protein